MTNNSNDAGKSVSKFYNSGGWETKNGITEDARRFRNSQEHAKEYTKKCAQRVLRQIPKNGENMLDMGSGLIQSKRVEYLKYSKNFKKRYCIDLSKKALEGTKKTIGEHGVFLHGSFFDIDLDENFFDCAISLHVLYHIDKDKQADAVRKLIRLTKPKKPVIIVYSNANTILKRLKLLLPKGRKVAREDFYSYSHPNKWWNRFEDVADVTILSFRSFSSKVEKALIPNNKIGNGLFWLLYRLEERFPNFFANHFQYPMIILTKK